MIKYKCILYTNSAFPANVSSIDAAHTHTHTHTFYFFFFAVISFILSMLLNIPGSMYFPPL